MLAVPSAELSGTGQLDAYFHLSEGRRLARHADEEALLHRRLGAVDGVNASTWMPNRMKQVPAVAGEDALPYLRPSDTLNYIPRAANDLSATRNKNVDEYRLAKG